MPPPRLLQLVIGAVVLLTAFYTFLPSHPRPKWRAVLDPNSEEELAMEHDVFKQLSLPRKFEYRRHCFIAQPNPNLRRESVIDLPHVVLSEPRQVEIDEESSPEAIPESLLPQCDQTIYLDVPEWDSGALVNTSSLIFGVATTMKRIEDALDHMTRWLSDSGTPLVVLLVDQPKLDPVKEDLDRIYEKAAGLRIDLIMEPYEGSFKGDSEGIKNFALAPVLDKNRRNDTQWFGIIDDDTFFLSLPRAYQELSKYNHSEMYYIGALSEGFTRVKNEGLKGWGGASFFFSAPLFDLLVEHHKPCKKLDKFYGDLLWRDCVLNVTSPTVRLTEMKGLNQIDLWGDLAGWYEGPHVPLITLHHWHSWHSFPVPNAHLIADAAGPDSLLQRYRMLNSTVLTNGFSIVEYPKGIPDLNRVELTFADDVGKKEPPNRLEFHHSIGATRPALEKGMEKISWYFRQAIKTSDGTIRQFYVQGLGNDASSVIELDWQRGE